MGVFLGVPLFASDAVSSCARATDEILYALLVARAAGVVAGGVMVAKFIHGT
ncbi:MAG: hypothetical protein H5T86_06570 [Armatimonadetes bacterium]|nr:hypothetical protein [Armatimonadota bacterium]